MHKRKKSTKPQVGFLEKTNKIDVTSKIFKREWEKTHITKIRNDKEGTITDPANTERIIRIYLNLFIKFKILLSCDIAWQL